MTPLSVLFTVCHLIFLPPLLSTAAPEPAYWCEDVELPGYGSPQLCALLAQPSVAEWIEQHRPGWDLDGRIVCAPGVPV